MAILTLALKVAVVGASIAWQPGGYPTMLHPGLEICVAATPGHTAGNAWLEGGHVTCTADADVVITMFGSNEALLGISEPDATTAYTALLNAINPTSLVILNPPTLNWTPTTEAALNSYRPGQAALCAKWFCDWVDLKPLLLFPEDFFLTAFDPVHPNPETGHPKIAAAINEVIPVPVPEPSTCAFVLTGVTALAWMKRRRA